MEEIKLEVPEEPPHHSVVLDGNDLAWQSLGGRWVRCGMPFLNLGPNRAKGSEATWVELLASGLLRVIYRAPVPEKETVS